MDLDDHATTFRFLNHDRAGQFTTAFDAVLAGPGIDTVKMPPGCPQANCFAERFALTARTDLAGRILRTLLRRHAHLITRRWSCRNDQIDRAVSQPIQGELIGLGDHIARTRWSPGRTGTPYGGRAAAAATSPRGRVWVMADGAMLVLGATGGQGGAVLDALLARGVQVRGLVRDTAAGSARGLADRGVEVVAGSLNDEASLAAAMTGVSGVFALTTPFEAGVDAEVEQGRAILTAARRTGVPHLVFSSVAGANQHSGVPHFDSKAVIETELAAADVPYTILGPTYFFDNALGGVDRIRGGVLDLPLPPHRPLQQLARPDLGAFAAEVLGNPSGYLGQRIELASDAPTPTQMAAALSKALDHPVRHEQVPLDRIGSPDMRAMWEFLNGPGYQVDIAALHGGHPDLGWISFAEWADHTFGAGS
jgi:uncharacterized protein YbjT (DUF2867 family)